MGRPGPVCCGLIPHLELIRRPDLYGQPVVVADSEERVVLAVSAEAADHSIRPGAGLGQAEQRCPQVEILPPEPELAARLRALLSAALYDLAPAVEVRPEGVAWLDLAGVPRPGLAVREARLRLRQLASIEPRLGLASGPFTARLAAARARPGRLIEVDEAASFLAPLPSTDLQLGLPLGPEQMERLDLLGLRTLGQVAQIGPRQLESQLGRQGRLVAGLARGREPIWLEPWRPPRCTGARRQFEPPLEDREALLFVARALAGELAQELGLRGAGAKEVRVQVVTEAGPEDRQSLVRHPLSSAAELFGLAGAWLREWRPAAPVCELALELPQLEAAGRRQLRLWRGGDGSLEEVEAALERLQERHGEESVVRPQPALLGSPLATQRFAWVPK
jgi:nucleotidyltransferase/DNA polymerase involved in DNA repair